MALIRTTSGSGGGSGKAKYDAFTMPSGPGSGNKVSINCGFKPKQVMIFSDFTTSGGYGYAIFKDDENTSKSVSGYGNGYWYITGSTAANRINPNDAITMTSTGFDFYIPIANTGLQNTTANFIAIG